MALMGKQQIIYDKIWKIPYFFVTLHEIIDNTDDNIMAKRMILLVGMAMLMLTATAQDSPYIVKTKNVKKPVGTAAVKKEKTHEEDAEPTDFMGKNFRYYSMCDWKEGMRFMVIPEKYDLLVNTFHDAVTNKEVSSARLRHQIMVYQGHQDMTNGRVHINFTCEGDGKNYYYELPSGTFDDYCFGKLGVPTLAYLGDVDKAKELLTGQTLLTRTQYFREDVDYDSDSYREVKMTKNIPVKVVAVGVGTRAFPVKIIVEDEEGNQFYQNVAMSKTNSGMRDDEFIVDNEKYLFQGSFDFTGAEMAVSKDYNTYLNQTVHTKYPSLMSSKGSGKVRDVKVPRFTGFIIDEIKPVKGTSPYYTLTLRETESRRIYYKDVAFSQEDMVDGAPQDDYFGYLFGMGEGQARSTTLETRTAIREGRVIPGMTMEEVELAVGEASTKSKNSDGVTEWMYPRTNSILIVQFNGDDIVTSAKAFANGPSKTTARRKAAQRSTSRRLAGNGTPLQ